MASASRVYLPQAVHFILCSFWLGIFGSCLADSAPAGRMGGRKHKDKKKHKKARTTPQAACSNLQPVWAPQVFGMSPTMAAMQSMGGMLTLQAPAPPPQQQQKESSDSSSSNGDSGASNGSDSPSSSGSAYRRKKYNKSAKAKLTASASELGGLPSVRLGEALERCDSRIDPTVTADHSREALLQLIYIVTGLKPSLKLAHLRVKDYSSMYARFKAAFQRRKSKVSETLDALLEEPTAEKVRAVATELGWQASWLQKARKAKADPMAKQMTLPHCLSVVEMRHSQVTVAPPQLATSSSGSASSSGSLVAFPWPLALSAQPGAAMTVVAALPTPVVPSLAPSTSPSPPPVPRRSLAAQQETELQETQPLFAPKK